MIKGKKCGVLVVAALFVLSFCAPLYADQSEKSTVEKLLDILQQKGIITEDQHEELTEELGEEEKELEEQKQIVQEVKTKEEKRPQVGYKNGFYLKTPDDKFKLKMGGRVFADFRAYNSAHPSDSEFYISRARIYLSGTLYSYFDFKVQADFGKGESDLKDGFININYLPFAQFQMGQFKAPFSLERMSSSKYMPFIERALPVDNLTPDRDIGFMVHGAYNPFGLHYGVGIFNGTRANEGDADNHKDLVARVGLSPFEKRGPEILKGLHLGVSSSYGEQDLAYAGDRDYFWNKGEWKTAGDTEFAQLNDGVTHDGKRKRIGVELAWLRGPFSVQGEWMKVYMDDMRNRWGESHDLSTQGAYVALSYFLFGGERNFKSSEAAFSRPTITNVFDPSKGTWGAVELAMRYDRLTLSDGFFDHGYIDKTEYTDRAQGGTFGINWYFNDMVRFMFNYNHVEFDDYIADAKDDEEDVFLARFQLDF